ncbi:Protein of uncharacterised function (DUF498/DUF598) (plasmid) [Legionella adelaidensis]|uniref:Protein of uncharacterized function (DUF498/DUF598) n=1 Tax=Legionella adelaidensis TaxID=45056 RepID=A0A0W0R4F0_9GAMM|nr:MTH938/NDUFAF3 family protein [Legionella adelaidensis]KTC65925.1 hypothetical protein Lade_0583 [Legionella adelaidensis]VEH85545.1 Protein of uncharacterised function (DUF498/DUF598) [Legionella adelaidensis]
MHITREQTDKNAIQSYSHQSVKVDSIVYAKNVIISRNEVVTPWNVITLKDLNEALMAPLLGYQPEVIIIGHNEVGTLPPLLLLQYLSQLRVGLECMSIGAASRTFNVLLSENRPVVLGVIF